MILVLKLWEVFGVCLSRVSGGDPHRPKSEPEGMVSFPRERG